VSAIHEKPGQAGWAEQSAAPGERPEGGGEANLSRIEIRNFNHVSTR
jgi:hypothetical protein